MIRELVRLHNPEALASAGSAPSSELQQFASAVGIPGSSAGGSLPQFSAASKTALPAAGLPQQSALGQQQLDAATMKLWRQFQQFQRFNQLQQNQLPEQPELSEHMNIHSIESFDTLLNSDYPGNTQ